MTRYVYSCRYMHACLYLCVCAAAISVISRFHKRFISLCKREWACADRALSKYKSPKYLCMVAELEFWDPASTTVSVSAELFQFRQDHRQLRQNGPATSRSTGKQSANADADDSTADPRAATASAGTPGVSKSANASFNQNGTGTSSQYGSATQDPSERGEEYWCSRSKWVEGYSQAWQVLRSIWNLGLVVLQVQDMDWVMSQECNSSYAEVGVDGWCGYHREVAGGWLPWWGRACFSSGSPGSDILDRRWSFGDRQEHLERNPFWVGSSEEVAMQVWSSESSSQFRFVEEGVASPAVLLDKLREGLESWENLKRKYEERRKKQLEDDICRSCLQQMCPNKLQDHLDLQASRLVDYDSMKHEILAYIENVETRKEAKTGSAPMDVDSLAKSKGKGKDSKGKGKNGWSKGKGKGKNGKGKGGKDKGKGSWNHNQNQNGKGWNSIRWNQSNWTQQWNNKGKGKDKGGKSKHGDKRVAAVENAEAEGSSQTPHQPEPEITALFALEEMAERRSRRSERSGRSRSARSEAQQALSNAEEANEEMLKDRLEKIQQVMNQAALAGLDVDPRHLDEQKIILEDIKKMRAEKSKALREEVQARRAASAPAPARGSSRYLQDLEAGMHPRTAKKAEKDRQRAAEHQQRMALKRPTEGENPEESRKRVQNPHKHRGGRERSEKKRFSSKDVWLFRKKRTS